MTEAWDSLWLEEWDRDAGVLPCPVYSRYG